ncbi:unnamed protein product [Adineta ricciae]|uniref:LCCL domain-containing protein n=1 Tax=Adineta ricciae TaxID=249248 RepID=A0A814EAD7_ADIRI|nr:unnamed protein product [Adineta ricciae]CAF1279173.1 unnamed protein product [Adineta ricciae]
MHILLKIGSVSLVLIMIATAITLPIVMHFLRQNKDTAISSNETTTTAAASRTTLMTSSQEHGNSTNVTANIGVNTTAVIDDASKTQSIYSSVLNNASLIYCRDENPYTCTSSAYNYYDIIEINVNTSGNYTITSNSKFDTYGYIYNKTFSPFFPSVNLVKSADDEGGNHQFLFDIDLQAGTMVTLVITTYSPNTAGAFSVIVAGPTTVQFLQLNITAPRLPLPSPINLVAFRGTNRTLTFGVVGSASANIWGTTIYTDDSPTAVTSVHSGFVRVGQRCVVTFMMLPGQDEYIGSTQNGITSRSWIAWVGSYTIIQSTCID